MKIFYAILLFIIAPLCYGQKEFIFEKSTSLREYSMPLPYPCVVKLKNGKKQTGVIYRQTGSVIVLKIGAQTDASKYDTAQAKKIRSDTSLSKNEKQRYLMILDFSDSAKYQYSTIKKIHFDLLYKKHGVLRAVIGITACTTGLILLQHTYELEGMAYISFAAGFCIFRGATHKNIRTKKWNLKTDLYQVIDLDQQQ